MMLCRSPRSYVFAAVGLAGSLFFLAGCAGENTPGNPNPNPTGTQKFAMTKLISNLSGVANNTDANLVNPWGISFAPMGPFWVSDNGSGKVTTYNGSGAPQTTVVNIPTPTASTGGAVTGQVFNSTSDFTLADGKPALFIFATEDGTISAWDVGSGANAELKVNNSPGSVYKGLATGSTSSGNFIYATNFRAGRVDVFDKNFKPVFAGSFVDSSIPAGFAPFGIRNIGGNLYVTYAKLDAALHDDVDGPGNGFVDIFTPAGTFVKRLITQGQLNSPWGLALAPTSFGRFGSDLLVGNFGDGTINAFDPNTGAFVGQLLDTNSQPITIVGLWGLTFGNDGSAGASTTLFFTAGIGAPPNFTTNRESNGLFGSLTPSQ